MKPYTYLIINLACIAIPLIASFYPKHSFYKNWPAFFKANIIISAFFLVWDYWFTEAGIWGFNSDYLTGIYFGNLPLEEILFFICIPFACVFTYFALLYLLKTNTYLKTEKLITYVLIITLLSLAIVYNKKSYTSLTFMLTSAFLLYTKLSKVNLSIYYISYLLIFPFFILSNGILTGSIIEAPIVWYNANEIIGLRLFTIPIEDSLYGLLLIFSNILLFNFFRKNLSNKVEINC
ncbi:lycopene cyclase domain-containing protein [Mangrovimonas aestuarii]|uniref:lycopene cyclase domain-containing protein n=1 Tax=Mangrovimonas aestuarii TaxID=3018443 RepID=UPI002378CF93|nr:lycopene cyclase domain-containing protein [Mangrovimonas aestuarii]